MRLAAGGGRQIALRDLTVIMTVPQVMGCHIMRVLGILKHEFLLKHKAFIVNRFWFDFNIITRAGGSSVL